MTTSSVDPMAHELAYAVSQGRIAPYVQAVVDVRSGDVVGYQGLARWRHRTRVCSKPPRSSTSSPTIRPRLSSTSR